MCCCDRFKQSWVCPSRTGQRAPTLRMRTYGKPSGPTRLPLTSMCFSHWMWGWGSLNTLHSNSTSLPTATVRLAGKPACRMGLWGERSAMQPDQRWVLRFGEQRSKRAMTKTNTCAIMQKRTRLTGCQTQIKPPSRHGFITGNGRSWWQTRSPVQFDLILATFTSYRVWFLTWRLEAFVFCLCRS